MGGKTKGDAKRRTSEQARAAQAARWQGKTAAQRSKEMKQVRAAAKNKSK